MYCVRLNSNISKLLYYNQNSLSICILRKYLAKCWNGAFFPGIFVSFKGVGVFFFTQDKNGTRLRALIGSLRNHDGDARDNVDLKNYFTLFIAFKAITILNLEHINKFEIKTWKISRGGSRFPDNAEFGNFTLLFCRGRQRNVPEIITHMLSHCSPH